MCRRRIVAGSDAAGGDPLEGQRPEPAEKVGDGLGVAPDPPARRQPLQFGLDFGKDAFVKDLPDASVSDEGGDGLRVEGEQMGSPLGARKVLLVEERAGVPEEQRAREGRRRRRLRLDDANGSGFDALHEAGERGKVVNVLEAFPRGLDGHGKVAELPGRLQELAGSEPLEPQRRPAPGARRRRQQSPGRAFAEACGEKGGAADLARDEAAQFFGVENHKLGAGRPAGRCGQLEGDAVVAREHLRLNLRNAAYALAYRHGPRLVHSPAHRAVQDEAPAAVFVPAPLEHKGLVARDRAGCGLLFEKERDEVLPRVLVEPGAFEPGEERRRYVRLASHARRRFRIGGGAPASCGLRARRKFQARLGLAEECALRRARGGRPPRPFAPPKGQARTSPADVVDDDAVACDLANLPARRAQGDDVADPALVDHLLVELADAAPPRLLGALGKDHGEHASVGNRAGKGDGEPLRAGTGAQNARLAVPHDSGREVGEVGGGVGAGEQLEDGVKGLPRQSGVGGGAAHRLEPAVGGRLLDARCGNGLLGKHVQRVRD